MDLSDASLDHESRVEHHVITYELPYHELRTPPKDQATYVTKNQRMCEAAHQQKFEILVTSTAKAHGTLCDFVLPDGTVEQRVFDAVILCHGFRTELPWLKVPLLTNLRHWFPHCFPSGMDHWLFFVRYARPHQGGISCTAEMLSRYIAMVLGGHRHLPENHASLDR
jgi:dimethylaniline monooxygenase (N-oxide forming)